MRKLQLQLCVLLGGITLMSIASAQESPSLAVNKANRTVAITASERVTRMADLGVVHIGFVQYGPSREAVYTAGAGTSNKIVDALVRAGVKRETIQSESQEITETQIFSNPQPPAEERQARAMTLHQSWTVRVGADDAARVLDVAVKAGANQSGQIDWQLSDPNAVQAEAAAKAIQRAQAQAKAMAAGLGVRLGDLLYASNQVEGSPVLPVPRKLGRMEAMAAAAPAPPLAINPREIETAATVYAVFALE